jgi:hypothetical protein
MVYRLKYILCFILKFSTLFLMIVKDTFFLNMVKQFDLFQKKVVKLLYSLN